MKNVAYISVYRDNTGYGDSAIECINALSLHSINVTPIWVSLSGLPTYDPGERIKVLEESTYDKYDCVIQHITPNYFCRKEGVKNIGVFFWETSSFRGSSWQNSCNLMDEIWVTSEEQKQACISSGVTVPVKLITIPRNKAKYSENYGDLKFNRFVSNSYKFYTISDISHRKNVFGLLNAFLSEFSSRDNVSLILKSYISGKSYEQSMDYLKSAIKEIKGNIKKPEWAFPQILMSTRRLHDREINSLHQSCDCYVTASRGEGDCLPAVDAALFGNPVIAGNWNGIRSNFYETNHPLINNLIEKPVIGMKNQPSNYYNFDETWFEPDTFEMMKTMRKVYENRDEYKNISNLERDRMLLKFDPATNGAKMKGYILND